ncbi:MAG: DUF72 domain-containing protein [Saprospiraceae bacterium]|nr:DUF72 domain-containing protein [Saprospiraceae bacterium]
MEFGKLQSIESVDFTLPADVAGTAKLLAQSPASGRPPAFFIGCTGWSMKEWVGKVYPEKAKASDFLRHYSRQFNTIELNTTHYRIPDWVTIQKWKNEAAGDFRFCPKLPQTISHSNNLGISGGELPAFCESIQQLEEKLGCCFMQLPPYFGVDRLPVIERFIERFPKHIPLALELRHESWFGESPAATALFALMEMHRISTVITDVAGRRDVLHMRLTNDTAMVRFVGNNLHPTDYLRVDAWVARIATWFEQGLQEVFFFTHEPDNLLAPELALYVFERARQIKGIETRGPKLMGKEPEGGQMRLF